MVQTALLPFIDWLHTYHNDCYLPDKFVCLRHAQQKGRPDKIDPHPV